MVDFARLDDNNIVINVIVVDDSDAPDEATGIAFCKKLVGEDTNWVQSTGKFDHAVKTMKYDSTNDAFYYPSGDYPSWVLNTSTWRWENPVPVPSDAGLEDADPPTFYVAYTWDEDTTSWTNRTVLDLP